MEKLSLESYCFLTRYVFLGEWWIISNISEDIDLIGDEAHTATVILTD